MKLAVARVLPPLRHGFDFVFPLTDVNVFVKMTEGEASASRSGNMVMKQPINCR